MRGDSGGQEGGVAEHEANETEETEGMEERGGEGRRGAARSTTRAINWLTTDDVAARSRQKAREGPWIDA